MTWLILVPSQGRQQVEGETTFSDLALLSEEVGMLPFANVKTF